MSSGVNTSAGSRIFIGTTSPTPSSDTYTEIGEVTSIGEFGRTYGQITHSSLGNRLVRKFKGTIDDGNITLDLAISGADAGQIAAKAALNSDFDYNFKITLDDPITPTTGTPTSFIFSGKVMSFPTTIGNNMQVTTGRITIGIESGTIVVTAAT